MDMKVTWLVIGFFCCAVSALWADIIRTMDGRIYLGNVISAESGAVTVEAGGRQVTLSSGNILKTEKDFETLKTQIVEIELKDKSVVSGKVTDYDADIGLLLDIEFGSLTIPAESIEEITDPVQEKIYNGYPFQTGAQGSFYLPVGDLASSFSPSVNVLGFFELNPGLFRGLFFRFEGGARFASYPDNTSLDFALFSLNAGVAYRVLFLRTTSVPFLNIMVPYLFAGVGVTYVALHDNRENVFPADYGEMNLNITAQAGFDFFILNNLVVRVYAGWTMIMQMSTPLHLIEPGIGVVYCF
jgi:hypothetical protein